MPRRASESDPAKHDLADLGQILEFMRLLWAVDHGLQSTSKRMQSELGVTGPQRLVLRIVGKYPGIVPSRLAAILHVDKSTITGVLQRLERNGALTRERDPEDGRRVRLTLTARGRALDASRAGTVEAAIRRILPKLPKGKVEAAADVLAVLASELDSD